MYEREKLIRKYLSNLPEGDHCKFILEGYGATKIEDRFINHYHNLSFEQAVTELQLQQDAHGYRTKLNKLIGYNEANMKDWIRARIAAGEKIEI